MVMTMFTGWTGSASMIEAGWPKPARPVPALEPPALEFSCALRRGLHGTIVLSTSSPEVTARKTVYPDGRVALEVARGSERLTIATGDVTVTVVRAHYTAVVSASAPDEEALLKFREPLMASGAVRSLRVLLAAIEDTGGDGLEHAALRLTGALIGQLDGDCAAIPRLCREWQAALERRPRGRKAPVPPERAEYRRAVLRAARQMESDMAAYACWNPARYGCAFGWLSQVETAWHACVMADPTALPPEHTELPRNRWWTPPIP